MSDSAAILKCSDTQNEWAEKSYGLQMGSHVSHYRLNTRMELAGCGCTQSMNDEHLADIGFTFIVEFIGPQRRRKVAAFLKTRLASAHRVIG